MRFEVRFANGSWKLFDTHDYCAVAWYGLQKDAVDDCVLANKNFS